MRRTRDRRWASYPCRCSCAGAKWPGGVGKTWMSHWLEVLCSFCVNFWLVFAEYKIRRGGGGDKRDPGTIVRSPSHMSIHVNIPSIFIHPSQIASETTHRAAKSSKPGNRPAALVPAARFSFSSAPKLGFCVSAIPSKSYILQVFPRQPTESKGNNNSNLDRKADNKDGRPQGHPSSNAPIGNSAETKRRCCEVLVCSSAHTLTTFHDPYAGYI
jgi:hypothetical protein